MRDVSRYALALLWLAWALFAYWCVAEFPPCIDLPVHSSHMQLLADLVRHRTSVGLFYTAAFPVGYGATSWLFMPVAMLTNGSIAGRLAVWLTLVLLPVSHAALARALNRSEWLAVLAAPFAFCLSYWYGFLPTYFAMPWVFFGWAAFVKLQNAEKVRALNAMVLLACSLLAMLSHIVAFGIFAVGVLALAVARGPLKPQLARIALTLLPALVFASSFVVTLVQRIFEAKGQPPNPDLEGHATWQFTHYGTDERLSMLGCAFAVLLCAFEWWRVRKTTEQAPAFLFAAIVVLWVLTPMSISRAWLIHARVPIFAAYAGVLLVDLAHLRKWVIVALVGLGVISLAGTVHLHRDYRDAVEGLAQIIEFPTPPNGAHGGIELGSLRINDGELNYLDHAFQWWTATQGGASGDIFGHWDHQPLRFAPGKRLPDTLTLSTPIRTLNLYDALLLHGAQPMTGALWRWRQQAQVGTWRIIERPAGDPRP